MRAAFAPDLSVINIPYIDGIGALAPAALAASPFCDALQPLLDSVLAAGALPDATAGGAAFQGDTYKVLIERAVAGTSAMIMGFIEARYGTIGMWPFLLCFAPQIATISLIGPNSMAMALQRYPHMAGTASSLMGVMQFGIGALFGAAVGQAFDGTILPMTIGMGVAGMLCLLSNRLLVRGG